MEPAHYFTERPSTPSAPRTVRLRLPDVQLDLVADSGVFSGRQLDPGTRLLLRHAPVPRVDGDLLDLGCGYGPIALTLATRNPDVTVWAVDVNERALELVTRNAAAAGLGNVMARKPEQVPDAVRFAAIYSNPPIRIGKPALHELLLRWLSRLVPDGAAWLVVQRNLGSDSLARWLTERGYPTRRIHAERGYRLLEIDAAPAGTDPWPS
ncbi:MAG TPA: methyltransferase [Actinomycetes bacterium]|nr:methyltransferase [Actinomycetes bacterium]